MEEGTEFIDSCVCSVLGDFYGCNDLSLQYLYLREIYYRAPKKIRVVFEFIL